MCFWVLIHGHFVVVHASSFIVFGKNVVFYVDGKEVISCKERDVDSIYKVTDKSVEVLYTKGGNV